MARFLFGHQIFDELVKIEFGSSILILDENFSEGKELLSTLIKRTDWASPINFVEATSGKPTLGGEVLRIGLPGEDLTYTGVTLNEFRRSHRRWMIIHSYLPEFLVMYEPEQVMRLIESWREVISQCETLEFFLLPKGTFPETERVLKSITDGVIVISKGPEDRFPTFTAVRCTMPEYAGRGFQYLIEGGRLLIKWGKDFVDYLPVSREEQIRERVKYLENKSSFLKIVKGPNATSIDLPLKEKILISQVLDRDVEQVLILFHDRRSEILEKLVRWSFAGYIGFINSDSSWPNPRRKRLSLKTRLMLRLPTRLASWLASKVALNPSYTMPVQAYWMRSRVDDAFYSLLFPKGIQTRSLELTDVHEFFQDFATRLMTYDVIEKIGEDPRSSLDTRYLPKVIGMMLKMGYSTECSIEKVRNEAIRVRVRNCPVCEDVRGDRPYCNALSGAIRGNAIICFKRNATCVETSCRAVGDEECVFYLELSPENSEKRRTALEDYSLNIRGGLALSCKDDLTLR